MQLSEMETTVLEYHVSGWPVSVIDERLGLDDGTARSIVVSMWRKDNKEWTRRKLKLSRRDRTTE